MNKKKYANLVINAAQLMIESIHISFEQRDAAANLAESAHLYLATIAIKSGEQRSGN